ncbi:MAG: hypothetical protein LLF89_07390 [Spirochaetaceae bacterium]|nr:hypothetical protein [Spirochaetaceae bacterium]
MEAKKRYIVSHGASWVLPDGRVLVVPGFHENWLLQHPSIASGARNTAEFVKKSGWLSAVLHEKGFLDVIIRSKDEEKVRECLWNVVSTNAASLEKVIVMVLDKDGYIVLAGEDFLEREAFDRALDMPTDSAN